MNEPMYLRYDSREEARMEHAKAIHEGAIVGPIQFSVMRDEFLFAHMGWKASDE